MTFDELFDQARQGNRAALQALLSPYLPALTGFVRLRMGPLQLRESSADVVQSVCCQVIEGLDQLEGDSEPVFKRWLYSIALNKILDKRKHHTRQKRDLARDVAIDTKVEDTDLLQCYAAVATPSREAMAGEEIARIEKAFDALPDDYREVLIMSRIMSLTSAEIGERLGKSEEASRQLLFRARARLSILLTKSDL